MNNTNHYKLTFHDTTLARRDHIVRELKILEENGQLPKNAHQSLLPKTVRTSPFYLLPKIHKINNPGRPIVSGIDSPTDVISGTLDRLLKPLLKYIPSYIRDTKHFLNIIQEIHSLDEDEIMVTIDVSALYTSIPHSEGLEAVRSALTAHPNPHIGTDVIIFLLEIVLKNNTFKFDNKYYHQIQGTAMGTKVAPTYANIFMGYIEKKILTDLELKARHWYRFIDDIFAIYRCTEDELLDHLRSLNEQHETIKFTHEYSREEIHFLDVTISRSENNIIETSLHRKPTDANLYLHYLSHHPTQQKD